MKVRNQAGEIVEIPKSNAISPYNALVIQDKKIVSPLPEYPHQWPDQVVSHQAWNENERRYQEAVYYYEGKVFFSASSG